MSSTRLSFLSQGECHNQVRDQNCVSAIDKKITESNLTKLHRKIEHNEKICCAQELGSYTQGQGHIQVRGQNQI